MTSEYLFPRRLHRRDFLAASSTAMFAASTSSLLAVDDASAEAPVTIGSGKWTYTLDPNWGVLPEGMKYGFGCGIVVDGNDRVYVTSRSTSPCVAIFDKNGDLEQTWSKGLADAVGYTTEQVKATAHGIYWSKEPGGEFLYFTENAGPGGTGKRVYKTDLDGKVLFTIGNVEMESDTSMEFEWSNPTDVAVAPNGDIYVVDGYGSQRVSRFDKDFKHLGTIGSRGKNNGQFNTCHGVWISTLNKDPEVYIADRNNSRIQVFSLELEYQRTIAGDFVRNPCCFYQHQGHLYIPDLASLVVIIDANDKPVAKLGDGRGQDKTAFEKGLPSMFQAPHALTVDSKGNLYVLEWVPYGRVRKFAPTPA